MTTNPYWLVSGLSYEDALRLASADCVENFQRDARNGETKFWPGDHAVFDHLFCETQAGVTITRADGTADARKEVCKVRKVA